MSSSSVFHVSRMCIAPPPGVSSGFTSRYRSGSRNGTYQAWNLPSFWPVAQRPESTKMTSSVTSRTLPAKKSGWVPGTKLRA